MFTILICHLPHRAQLLNRLLTELERQASRLYGVKVDWKVNDEEKTSIGKKRNDLISKCETEYCAFVDDDDMVSPDYLQEVTTIFKDQPDTDVIGITGIIVWDNKANSGKKFIHSIQHEDWKNEGTHYTRPPNHLNPMRTEYFKKFPFPEISHGEDRDFSDRLKEYFHNAEKPIKEVFIPKPIYYYLYNSYK